MPLRNSTRKCCISTDFFGRTKKISLPLKQLQANAGRSEQVWIPTQIEKYLGRPNSAKYNKHVHGQIFFSTHYQVSSAIGNSAQPDDDSDEETESDEMHNETDIQQCLDSSTGIKKKNEGEEDMNVSSQRNNTNKQRQKSKPI